MQQAAGAHLLAESVPVDLFLAFAQAAVFGALGTLNGYCVSIHPGQSDIDAAQNGFRTCYS